jgi:hypothetical protein
MMEEDVLKACRRMFEKKVQLTSQIFAHLMCGYSSLGMYVSLDYVLVGRH